MKICFKEKEKKIVLSVFYMSYKVIPSGKFDFAVFNSAM